MELVEIAGRRMAYHRAGSGEPLVLLHGGWSDGRAWRPQLTGLADRFDLIAWDTPGCGGSEDPAGPMTLSDYADELAELVAALDIAPAHLCGLSWGGGLAIAVWQRHPELVRSLVLAGAYAGSKGSFAGSRGRGASTAGARGGRTTAGGLDRRVPAELLRRSGACRGAGAESDDDGREPSSGDAADADSVRRGGSERGVAHDRGAHAAVVG